MTPAEDQLLSAVRAGDDVAFLTLYRRHTAKLYGTVLRLLGGADAEDAVQETWLRALRGLPSFRGESSFSTWLVGIGIRCALEILRKRPGAADADIAEPRGDAAPHLTIDLERAIAALPGGYRAVFVLHDIEGLTHEEIGGLLGVEPGTSKSQLFHARRALRQRLRPTSEGVAR
jgi:RNA polymerase sigma-70 factor (ECF subfamily)